MCNVQKLYIATLLHVFDKCLDHGSYEADWSVFIVRHSGQLSTVMQTESKL